MTTGPRTAGGPLDLRRLAVGVRLTPAQRRILAYLVEHASEAPWLSASELAARVGVSQPSVTRLAAVLGFEGYAALRDRLRRTALSGAAGGPEGGRLAAVLADEAANLAGLGSSLPDPPGWAAIGRAVSGSVPVVVAGFRAARYLAVHAAYLLRKVHPAVVEIDHGGADAADALVEARASGATVAVVVCVPRYPTETVRLLAEAADLGYRILLVADEAMPPVPGVEPEWRLAVPVGSGLTFDAHPAALLALSVLLEAVCDAEPTAAEGRLEALDVAAGAAGTYWDG